jgi:hypothetical protein
MGCYGYLRLIISHFRHVTVTDSGKFKKQDVGESSGGYYNYVQIP